MRKKKAKTVRLGLAGYVRLLAILRTAPHSTVELEAAAGIGHNTANRIMGSMYALGMIHIADWRMDDDSPTQPRFLGFAGEDSPPPTRRPNGRPIGGVKRLRNAKPTSEMTAFASLIRALEVPASRADLAEATGMNDQTIRAALRAMLKERMVRVALWTPRLTPGGPYVPNFQMGAAPSAPRPSKTPAAELRRRYLEGRRQREIVRPLVSLAAVWRKPAAVALHEGVQA